MGYGVDDVNSEHPLFSLSNMSLVSKQNCFLLVVSSPHPHPYQKSKIKSVKYWEGYAFLLFNSIPAASHYLITTTVCSYINRLLRPIQRFRRCLGLQ